MSAPTPGAVALVNRIEWTPGSDELRARCHCGARRTAQDPIEVWAWLLDHPVGHVAPGDRA